MTVELEISSSFFEEIVGPELVGTVGRVTGAEEVVAVPLSAEEVVTAPPFTEEVVSVSTTPPYNSVSCKTMAERRVATCV